MDVIAGTPTNLMVQLVTPSGTAMLPDVGSVTYTIQNSRGTAIAGLADVDVTTTSTSYVIEVPIPITATELDPTRRFDRREVVVNYTSAGQEAKVVKAFRIIPAPLYSVAPASVRSFIGIEEHELPDADIDIFSAYLLVEKALGADVLNAALTSGTTDELAANTLIRMKSVLDVLPSARQRMAQSEKNGVKEFTRVDLKELDKLRIEAETRYQEAYDEIAVVTTGTVSVFLAVTNTDAITGA